jgi:hypothetical protein
MLSFLFIVHGSSFIVQSGSSRGGEIGIRARLRISWSRDCAGSSPALGTNIKEQILNSKHKTLNKLKCLKHKT